MRKSCSYAVVAADLCLIPCATLVLKVCARGCAVDLQRLNSRLSRPGARHFDVALLQTTMEPGLWRCGRWCTHCQGECIWPIPAPCSLALPSSASALIDHPVLNHARRRIRCLKYDDGSAAAWSRSRARYKYNLYT